jgi:hypothetical protein
MAETMAFRCPDGHTAAQKKPQETSYNACFVDSYTTPGPGYAAKMKELKSQSETGGLPFYDVSKLYAEQD